jgi:hypothetical protein
LGTLLEAERFLVGHAALIVHSFRHQDECLDDFAGFLALFRPNGDFAELVPLDVPRQIPPYAGWARGDKSLLDA